MINSRNKGASGERELAKVLSNLLGATARRGQQHSGLEGKDVVIDIEGLHVECKRVEKLNIHNAVEQSKRDAQPCELPIVCHRKNRQPWLVTCELSQLIELSKLIVESTNKPRQLDEALPGQKSLF
jgi:hypothetical protein